MIGTEDKTFFRRMDTNFLIVIFAINVVGLINLFSATHGLQLSGLSRMFVMQSLWLILGWGVFFAVTLLNYKFMMRAAPVLYALNLLALMAVAFFGSKFYGAQRWLDLGLFKFQPSETMKIVLILMLSRYLSSRVQFSGFGFKELAVPALIALVPFALVVRQPDLGTALTFLMITGIMLIFCKLKAHVLVTMSVLTLVSVPVAWNFLKPYQKDRVMTFLNPGRDPRGTGYNSIQSKIAVGSGNLLGKGFRKGTQSQLEFLPERHTDFIFSVLSEEHGFIGSTTTLALFVALFLIMARISSQARDRTGALLAVGLLAYLFCHFFINIGMVIGILPIVGIPLPLLSYGGSSMLSTMVALGLVSSVAYHRFMF